MKVRSGARAGFALVGGMGLVLLAGCSGSGLETGAGKVDSKTAAAFVATADADWHKAVDAGQGQNLSPEGRCYFVTGNDGKQSLGTVACGPIRRLGSTEGQVWDLSRIETTTTGDEVGFRIPDGEVWQHSVVRPSNSTLWRPDDKQPPADADTLAAPAAPPAESRLVVVQDQLRTTDLKESSDTLIAPDRTLTLTGLGTLDTLGEGTAAKSPASGERFLVARFKTSPTAGPFNPGSPGANNAPATTWSVAVGSDRRPVEVVANDPEGATPTPAGDRYIVASVPEDAQDVSLTATSGTVTQAISLVSGKRTSTDVAAAYYRPETVVNLGKTLPTKTVKQGNFDASYGITLTKAALTPWDPEKGWAPAGQAWFQMAFADSGNTYSLVYDVTFNPAFFTATADGKPVLTGATGEVREKVTWSVPADVKTVRVKVTATATFRSTGSYEAAEPKSGTANFGSLVADATFR